MAHQEAAATNLNAIIRKTTDKAIMASVATMVHTLRTEAVTKATVRLAQACKADMATETVMALWATDHLEVWVSMTMTIKAHREAGILSALCKVVTATKAATAPEAVLTTMSTVQEDKALRVASMADKVDMAQALVIQTETETATEADTATAIIAVA